MFGAGNQRCLSCGVDLWDVERYVRSGGVVACERCVVAMAGAFPSEATGAIDVVVPPRLHGDAPDSVAVDEVTAAMVAVFGGGTAAERAAALEDAETLGPVVERAAQQYAGVSPRLVIDRVRFPTAERAEVRFRFLLHGGSTGIDAAGQLVRREGRWLVTRETVMSTVPGAQVFAAGGRSGSVGTLGVDRVALWAASTDDAPDDGDEPPDAPVSARR